MVNVWPRIFFFKTLLVLLHSLAQSTCMGHAIWKAARWISMHRLCVTLVGLERIPPVVNLQRKSNKERMGLPIREDTASSSGMGRTFFKIPDFSRNIPGRKDEHLPSEFMLTTIYVLGFLPRPSSHPSPYPDLQQGPCPHPAAGKALGSLPLPARTSLHCPGMGQSWWTEGKDQKNSSSV